MAIGYQVSALEQNRNWVERMKEGRKKGKKKDTKNGRERGEKENKRKEGERQGKPAPCIHQVPSRKQVAHSNWEIWRQFDKVTDSVGYWVGFWET